MRLVEECRHEPCQNNLAGCYYWTCYFCMAGSGAVDAAIPGVVAMTKQEIRNEYKRCHPDTNGGIYTRVLRLTKLVEMKRGPRCPVCGGPLFSPSLSPKQNRRRVTCGQICGLKWRRRAVLALAALWLVCFPVLGLESPRGEETFFKGKSVNLAWDPSPTTGVKYRVYWSKDGRFWYREETTNTVMTVIGLARNTTYRFKATAFVGSNESGPSNVLVYKTPKR